MKKYLNTIEEIEMLETKSAKCSDKYVPIKTTTFIKEMKGFDFNYGLKYKSNSSAHFVEMTKGEEVSVIVINSFDRSYALSMSFMYKGFNFGKIRQVHIGESASHMISMTSSINDWYQSAIGSIETMKDIKLDKQDMLDIATKAFKDRGANISTITNFSLENHDSALSFVLYLTDGIRDGFFERRTPSRGIKILPPVKREVLMIRINDNIWKYLEENNPELYI